MLLRANSTHARDIHLATFTSLQSLFERLPLDTPLSDAKAKDALQALLFDPSFEGLPEAMRVKRAEALVNIAKFKDCGSILTAVKSEADGGERSPAVRSILAKVGK